MTEIEEWKEHRNKRNVSSILHVGCSSTFPGLAAGIEENVALECLDEQPYWISLGARVYHPGLSVEDYLRMRTRSFDMIVVCKDIGEKSINGLYHLLTPDGVMLGRGQPFLDWVNKNLFIAAEGNYFIGIMPSLF